MTEIALKLAKVEAGYGDVQVLWGVDFEIPKGEISCLVGSNGAGKTTLLRTVSGLVRLQSGSLEFDGESQTDLSAHTILERGIAHVPEGRRLFKGLSVRDNLLIGAYLRRDKAGINADLNRILELFPALAERRNQDATTLSGGEQQMCAIGRGMMSRPKLLMIDELSLGLAPQVVETISDTLSQLRRDGMTILLIEQDVLAAFEIASHGAVLELGRVVLSGPTDTLANDPAVRTAYMGI